MDDQDLRGRFRRDFTNNAPHAAVRQVARPAHPPAPHRPAKSRQLSKRGLVMTFAVVIIIIGLAAGGYFYFKKSNKTNVLGESSQTNGGTTKYLPANLPSGYSYNNDFKEIKTNVFYYSVNGPGSDKFYVTIQPIPANFDFNAFGGKFLKPDQYAVSIGTVLAGPVGTDLIASIRSTSNSWVIINASNTHSLAELETVTRSLQLAQ